MGDQAQSYPQLQSFLQVLMAEGNRLVLLMLLAVLLLYIKYRSRIPT